MYKLITRFIKYLYSVHNSISHRAWVSFTKDPVVISQQPMAAGDQGPSHDIATADGSRRFRRHLHNLSVRISSLSNKMRSVSIMDIVVYTLFLFYFSFVSRSISHRASLADLLTIIYVSGVFSCIVSL